MNELQTSDSGRRGTILSSTFTGLRSPRTRDTHAEDSVTAGLRSSAYSPWYGLILLPILVTLPGCGGDVYSETMFYPVRSDLVIKTPNTREFPEPDRPGQLPLFSVKDMHDLRSPFYPDKENPAWYVDVFKLPSE